MAHLMNVNAVMDTSLIITVFAKFVVNLVAYIVFHKLNVLIVILIYLI